MSKIGQKENDEIPNFCDIYAYILFHGRDRLFMHLNGFFPFISWKK